jgi:hypothetical protein
MSRADGAEGKPLDLEHYKDEAIGGSIVEALNRAANGVVAALETSIPAAGRSFASSSSVSAEPGGADEELRRPAPLSELADVAQCSDSTIQPLVDALVRHGF